MSYAGMPEQDEGRYDVKEVEEDLRSIAGDLWRETG
jgi:hypothetical protein